MRLPITPRLHSEASRLPRTLFRRDHEDSESTIVDVSGLSVGSILIIIFIVIACLTTLLVTGYCVFSRRYGARIAAASRPSSRSRRTPTPEEEKAGSGAAADHKAGEGKRKKKGKKSPTMVFRQHEPEAHGYFAPLYFEGARGSKGPALGDVKREVSRVFEPAMLERAVVKGTREKQGSPRGSKEEKS